MTEERKPSLAEWVIVSVKEPVLWSRSPEETWLLNPRARYIVNASQLATLKDKVSTVSELKGGSRHLNPLLANRNLANASILVERQRDRGFGDYLFLTGPLNYIQHMAGNTASIDLYALADRGKILDGHPALSQPTPLVGPILYDNLPLYNYHWFVGSVTEFNEDRDQLNVYDALYQQLGVEPGSVAPTFKRPSMQLVAEDYKSLDSLYHYIYVHCKMDLRRIGYYVVAPSTNASLRSARYSMWLEAVAHLAKSRPVVVVGQPMSARVPATDMTYGELVTKVGQMGPNVINLIGSTPIRVVSALISRAVCAVTLDSGLLYVAEALRIPCVSLWGPVSPKARIGYDRDYMELAIFNQEACPHASCFAYHDFPRATKCPRGSDQMVCEPLLTVSAKQIIDKVQIAENRIAVNQAPAPEPSKT